MPQIRLLSLRDGAEAATGTVIIIDVFRAFSTAAAAFHAGARRIVMVDDVDQALALRERGVGSHCLGERGGFKPDGFDFANSPGQLLAGDIAGKTLIQTTTNGTAGIHAAAAADRIYACGLANASATAAAVLTGNPETVSVVAMGRSGRARADEDELCALYLRSRLQGREPDRAALAQLLQTMAPPPNPALIDSGDYHPDDRAICVGVDRFPLAIAVRREDGLLVAEAETP